MADLVLRLKLHPGRARLSSVDAGPPIWLVAARSSGHYNDAVMFPDYRE